MLSWMGSTVNLGNSFRSLGEQQSAVDGGDWARWVKAAYRVAVCNSSEGTRTANAVADEGGCPGKTMGTN